MVTSRRTHLKSRNGCQQCKARHVKCDERQPTCSLCTKRAISCVYPSPETAAGQSFGSPATITQFSQNGSKLDTTIGNPEHRTRLYEIRLFHHFMANTSSTLTRNPRDHYLWQTVVPLLATSHNYVMDSVLAIAALHLALANPEQSQSYTDSALDYHASAMAASRENLSLDSTQNQDACAICSICILITATAYSNMPEEKSRRDPLDYILEKRTILKGTRFLLNQLEQVPRHPFLSKWKSGNVESSEQAEQSKKYNLIPRALYGEILEKLSGLSLALEDADPSNKDILISTHKLLEINIRDWPFEAGEMSWPLEISDEYINLLRSGNWLARVLLMFYGLCLHLSSNHWAIQDSGRRLVLSILPRKTQVPAQWVDLITWIGQALEK